MSKNKFYEDGLYFKCTMCGKCCTLPEGSVEISEDEAIDICNFLKISQTDFLNQYIEESNSHANGEKWVLKSQTEGACIFYSEGQCRIYAARPVQCRTFPFWPELLKSRYRWKTTASWCEGMDQGEFYSIEEIESLLKDNGQKQKSQTSPVKMRHLNNRSFLKEFS